MRKTLFTIWSVLFLLACLGFSFWQHYRLPMDGDLPAIAAPAVRYSLVLKHPFGIPLLKGEVEPYASPNRCFAHWALKAWFDHVPGFIQSWFSPIESLYVTAAGGKTLIKLLLIMLLARLAITRWNWGHWLLAAVLVTPFFQTYGYYQMGIIDHSVTYTFFYALSMVLVAGYLLQFKLSWRADGRFEMPVARQVFTMLLALIIAFHGPLGAPLLVLSCLGICLWVWLNGPVTGNLRRGLPWLPVLFALAISLYSLFLGSFSTENDMERVPAIIDRLARLPRGLWKLYSQKLGLILLTASVVVMAFWPGSPRRTPGFQQWRKGLGILAMVALLYLLLLPFGGYRTYRPDIIRRDTFLPITLLMIWTYTTLSVYLLPILQGRSRWIFSGLLVVMGALFTLVDLHAPERNACEREALELLSNATASPVILPTDCEVLSWEPIRRAEDSRWQSVILERWKVCEQKCLYVQKPFSD